MSDVDLTCYGTDDGQPWAVFRIGHIDPALVTLDEINAALDNSGYDAVEEAEVEHLWIVNDPEDAGEEGLYPWHWCQADTPDAIAITGVKFP
ncbi:hypothetical protein SAMN06295912_1404 [Sphingomonas laterariae]|uniref:Uncharacterized protein n=1 Tax=Edaphosphingomonas laterariae TaxID=861865 RepID=A0A239JUH8_9SPHN|nr:hypothetical protein [Sphingomonas laterariae]SNT09521.1 hypothetical protein SAMN06295912_1404 [Sphingomonas laterariae]